MVFDIDVINVFLRFLFRSRFFTFLTFLNFFSTFFILKYVVKSKVWICKNPARNTLRGCLSNDFYWFWFVILQNILLTCWRVLTSHRFGNVTCVNTYKFWQSFLTNVYKRFYFFHIYYINVFLNFYRNVCYIYGFWCPVTLITDLFKWKLAFHFLMPRGTSTPILIFMFFFVFRDGTEGQTNRWMDGQYT